MIHPVFIAECTLPPISEEEVLRYAADKDPSAETRRLLLECIEECRNVFNNKVAYRELEVTRNEEGLFLGNTKIRSVNLEKNLCGCKSVFVFAATAGLEIDRLITKYAKVSPARALLLHSIGTERVEALCDAFCKKLSDDGFCIAPRFSPGYGDLSLNLQKDILTLVNADRTVGIGLNESLLLSPSKSVTAFIGIKHTERT